MMLRALPPAAFLAFAVALPAHAAGPLQWQKPKVEGEARDVFGSKSWYVPPPPPPPVKAAPPPPPPPPTAPPLPFTFLGKLLSEEGRDIFYLVKSDRVYPVSEGDVIDGTYRVDKAQGSVLRIIYLPLDIPQTINIGTGS